MKNYSGRIIRLCGCALLLCLLHGAAYAALTADCNADGVTDLSEVQSALNMFFETTAIRGCVDANGDGVVAIAEVQDAIASFLGLRNPSAAVAFKSTSAAAGGVVTVLLQPDSSGVSSPLSVFPADNFLGIKPRASITAFDVCQGGTCTAPIAFDARIPTNWPAGSYYFCSSPPHAACAKLDVTNSLPLSDQGTCTGVSLQGPSDRKIDIVFVADHFNALTIGTFSSKIEQYKDALLSVPPFSDHKAKFNFWKIERLGALTVDDSYAVPGPELWEMMTARCGGVPDIVAVVEGPDYSGRLPPFAMANYSIPWLMMTTKFAGYNGLTFVHEFGHAFGNLGDEYANTQTYHQNPVAVLRPNTDVAFCPKWCSGEPNTTTTLDEWQLDCWKAYQTFNDCLAKSGTGAPSTSAVQACWDLAGGDRAWLSWCDFGTGCRPGTGCYWNAKGTNVFRPSLASIMAGGELDTGFNPPSLDALNAKLDQYK